MSQRQAGLARGGRCERPPPDFRVDPMRSSRDRVADRREAFTRGRCRSAEVRLTKAVHQRPSGTLGERCGVAANQAPAAIGLHFLHSIPLPTSRSELFR